MNKDVRLQKLHLQHFKGIEEFFLDTQQGRDVTIYGDNATGKTTIADGLTWLLFDKDYSGAAQFEIKTLDAQGEPVHQLQHMVAGVFSTGEGGQIALKKVYQEKWTKKRGSAQAEFSGHTTDYFVDDVPVQKKDYVARVSEIATEDMFRLLTSPAYFSRDLHWEKRREILLDVCGDVSDKDVFAANPNLTGLEGILKDRSQESHVKVVKATMSKINDQLKQIPVRIDEVLKGIPARSESIDIAAEEKQLAEIRQRRKSLTEERLRIENSGQGAELKREIAEMDAAIAKVKAGYEKSIRDQVGELDQKMRAQEVSIGNARIKATRIKAELERLHTVSGEPDIAILDAKMQELRDQWRQVDESRYCYEATICPTCGQTIPEDPDAEEKFEDRKSRRLAEINAQGVKLKQEKEQLIEQHRREAESTQEIIAKSNAELVILDTAIKEAEADIEKYRQEAEKLAASQINTKQYIGMQEQRDHLAARLKAIESGGSDGELARIGDELSKLDGTPIEDRILSAKAEQNAKARVKELRSELKNLSAEYDRLSGELHLLEQFTEARVRLLEDKVASRFMLARFKLFDRQINGALAPCCEVLYDGVPYGTNLNSGARINVGLDIIATLSRHYGTSLPIIVDNAESVTELLPMEAQTIRLVVSADDKTLRTERR